MKQKKDNNKNNDYITHEEFERQVIARESPVTNIFKRYRKEGAVKSGVELRVLHCALGLITELQELVLAKEAYNIQEEAGDLYWFLALGYNAINVPFKPRKSIKLTFWRSERDLARISAVKLLDACKARIFYNRIKKNGKTFEQIVKKELDRINTAIGRICQVKKLSIPEVLTNNTIKLEARFGKVFSEKKANNRSYKKEEKAVDQAKMKQKSCKQSTSGVCT